VEQNPAIALFLALGVMIAVAKVGGSLARRLGQPRVFGELLAGVLLGPTVLDLLHWGVFAAADVHLLEATIAQLAELGVLLLMFLIGLEVNVRELLAVRHVAVLGGSLGALLPVVLTVPVVLAFGLSLEAALFTGVTLAATSVSISAQTMLELGVLRTKEGNALLATALVDDVLAIVLVSFVVATTGSAGDVDAGRLATIIVRMALFILLGGLFAWFVLPRVINWIHNYNEGIKGTAAFALIFALAFGWAAEALGGVAAITGAFIAGVGFSRAGEEVRHQIEDTSISIAYALLVPVFFIHVGLVTNLRLLTLPALPLATLLLLVAVISKIGGCGVGALLGGFNRGESMRLGISMISRGEVGLIIAAIGLAQGSLTADIFPSLFLVILVTTVLTPVLVRWAFQQKPGATTPEAEMAANT
jgi:Kef-type K+ transport system membrane component KefB